MADNNYEKNTENLSTDIIKVSHLTKLYGVNKAEAVKMMKNGSDK